MITKTKTSEIDGRAIDKVATLLDDGDWGVAAHAAETLGVIGPPAKATLPKLERVLQRADEEEKRVSREYGGLVGIPASVVVRRAIERITVPPEQELIRQLRERVGRPQPLGR